MPGVGQLRQVAPDGLHRDLKALCEIFVRHEAALADERDDLAMPPFGTFRLVEFSASIRNSWYSGGVHFSTLFGSPCTRRLTLAPLHLECSYQNAALFDIA